MTWRKVRQNDSAVPTNAQIWYLQVQNVSGLAEMWQYINKIKCKYINVIWFWHRLHVNRDFATLEHWLYLQGQPSWWENEYDVIFILVFLRPSSLSAENLYFFEVIHKQNDRGTDHLEVAVSAQSHWSCFTLPLLLSTTTGRYCYKSHMTRETFQKLRKIFCRLFWPKQIIYT